MDDEKLILLVQEREFLYNKFNPEYKKPEKNKIAWREIGMAMGFADDLCLKRWTSLRDRYAREKRLGVTPSGSASSCKPQWHLFSAMEFLSTYVTPRPMRCSANVLEMSQSPSSTQSSSDSPLPSPKISVASNDEHDIDISWDSTNWDSSTLSNQLPPPSTKKRKRNVDDVEVLFAEAVGAFKKSCEQQEPDNSLSGNQALQGFGKMILSTISDMSPAKQVKAIQKVTALVMEIRLEPED